MRIVFCPTVIGFAASLVEEIKEIKEIFLPPRRSLSAISAISAGLLVSHADSIFLSRSHRLCRFARRRNKGNKGNLCSDTRSLSAISAISAGLKTCQLVGFVLLSQRNEGNKGNLLPHSAKPFLLFLHSMLNS